MVETETFRNGFRLTYQGKPITQNISGCVSGSEICDINIMLDKYPSGNDWTSYCAQDVPTKTRKLLNWDFAVGVLVSAGCCAVMCIISFVISRWKNRGREGYTTLK